jgi:hypothetical protein
MNPPAVHYVAKGSTSSLCFVTRPKFAAHDWRKVNCKRCKAKKETK